LSYPGLVNRASILGPGKWELIIPNQAGTGGAVCVIAGLLNSSAIAAR